MAVLLCGSIAYDTIMVFRGRFKNHILPEQIHILNVSFLVPDLRREFGGCAGNIAYNLKLLGDAPLIMATVGDDFQAYRERLQVLGIAETHIRHVPGIFTAQAFITTDLDDNQITAFHPGAMNFSQHNRVAEAKNIALGIIAPDGREGMLQHAREFHEAGIPYVFDPGQGLPMFTGEELMSLIEKASFLTLNDYEARLLQERTGCKVEQLAKLVQAIVVTLGSRGSEIYTRGKLLRVPSVEASSVVDPTGCGDAYRAGLLYGIQAGWDWEVTGRLASLMGAIKVAARGGQNHVIDRDEIHQRYREAFHTSLM